MVPGFFIVYATSQKCIFLYIFTLFGLFFDYIKAYSLLFFIGYILFSYCFLRLQRKVHKYKWLKCAKIQLLTERVSHHRC